MDIRNVIIIGSGPAGYTAALVCVAGGFETPGFGRVYERRATGRAAHDHHGQWKTSPGFPDGIAGPGTHEPVRKQAQRFGTEVLDKDVESVDFSKRPFKVVTDEAEYRAKAVIIATGATAKRLHNDAEAKFWNRGISACATCDGALPIFRNKPIAVIGGGDTAMEEALYPDPVRQSQVILIHRRKSSAPPRVMVERVQKNPKILIKTPYVAGRHPRGEDARADSD
jgi:thioredoxin reductase (NADPH)